MDPGYSRAAIGLLALVFLTAQQVAASQSVPASPSPSATVTASQTPSIIAVPPILGNVSTAAGSTTGYADGVGSAAQFNDPEGVALGAGFLLVVRWRWRWKETLSDSPPNEQYASIYSSPAGRPPQQRRAFRRTLLKERHHARGCARDVTGYADGQVTFSPRRHGRCGGLCGWTG